MKGLRKALVLIVGVTLLLIGAVMIVLPGPATVVIPLGLAILGAEFIWAQRLLNYILSKAWTMLRWLTGSAVYVD